MNGQVELNSLRKNKKERHFVCRQKTTTTTNNTYIPQYTAKRFGRAIVQKVYSQHSNV